MTPLYQNRQEGGQALARSLKDCPGWTGVLVLAVSCGGIPVAVEVAEVLSAPLDLFVTQPISVPWHDEWQGDRTMGAVASGGVRIFDRRVVAALNLPAQEIEQTAALAHSELANKESACRSGRPFIEVRGRVVILLDDGIETAYPMLAAVEAMRARGVMGVIVAAPVGCASACQQLAPQADQVVCPCQVDCHTTHLFYRDFPPVTDEEVHALFNRRTSGVQNLSLFGG